MIEIAFLMGLLGVGLAVLLVATLGWFLFKLVFKIILFPIALALGALKIALVVVLGILALIVAPVLLTLGLILLIPLLAIGAVVGLGVAVFAIAT